jgi:hypothetical protein
MKALATARSLYAEQSNRTPTLMILLLVLEAFENPNLDTAARGTELFGSPEKAYEAMTGHWQRTRERFPVYGIATGLESLEKTLKITGENSIFNQPPPPQFDEDRWFRE